LGEPSHPCAHCRACAGGRKANHKVAREITLQQMLHEWAMHDLGHIRQIGELVRARKHWQAAGQLREFYTSGREKHRSLAVAPQLWCLTIIHTAFYFR
jgi:hypothetical protein